MAYGTPNSLDEIEPYYTDIRGGRKPSPENLHELIERYKRVGGRTPLLDITREQAMALQSQLGDDFCVYVGMKHWHPYIAETVGEIVRDGHRRIVALALAPHYSRFSIDGYILRLRDAIERVNGQHDRVEITPLDVTFVESWNVHPLFLRAVAEKMEAVRQAFGLNDWEGIQVIFSAHSLPARILEGNDPYPGELEETCMGVAALVGLERRAWRFAYQSAGRTSEKWLGPDILETLDQIAAEGHRRVLIAPIGFVADHLEVLYDIDVECAERARVLGLELRRTESPNASPTFISALAAIVHDHMWS
jgi:protoporphyrin/coproporphyrin ferrochelatase